MNWRLISPALALFAAIATSTFVALNIDPSTEVSNSLAAQAYGGAATPICTYFTTGTCGTAGQNNCSGAECMRSSPSPTTSYGYGSASSYCGSNSCGAVATATSTCGS